MNLCVVIRSFVCRNGRQINTSIDYVIFLSACVNPQMSYMPITRDTVRQTVATVTSMLFHAGKALYKLNN